MRKNILVTYCILHLLFLALVNVTCAYDIYSEFYHTGKNFHPAVVLRQFFDTAPCSYYGRYTGAETGYGFFGVNVRSNGLLIGECNGHELSPDFISYESSLRFFSMANSITDELLKEKDNKDTFNIADKKKLLNPYYGLVLKNIAITLLQKSDCSDTLVTLSYNLLNFPSLAELRNGKPAKYELNKLLTMGYRLRKDEK